MTDDVGRVVHRNREVPVGPAHQVLHYLSLLFGDPQDIVGYLLLSPLPIEDLRLVDVYGPEPVREFLQESWGIGVVRFFSRSWKSADHLSPDLNRRISERNINHYRFSPDISYHVPYRAGLDVS